MITDSDHLLVMNSGRGFWHEERTLADDPPLRMLQIFVRPHSLDLEPTIQHGPIPEPTTNEWRSLFGPEGSDAPFSVRNEVEFYDIRLEDGASARLPDITGWDGYFYVFEGHSRPGTFGSMKRKAGSRRRNGRDVHGTGRDGGGRVPRRPRRDDHASGDHR